MRVLLVGKGAPERGGIPVFLESLLASRLAEEVDLEFLNLATDAGDERRGGRFSAGNVVRAATDAIRVWRRAPGNDIVHIHSAAAPGVTLVRAGLLAAAGRARRARTVVHVHGGLLALWLSSPRRRRVAKAALAAATEVVTVSADAEAALAAVVPGVRLSRIDNGVDVDRFVPGPVPQRTAPQILYVGLLTARKGLLDLFAASSSLLAEGLDHELVIVGGMPDEGSSAEAEVRAAAPTHARLVGTRTHDDMPAVYAGADVFCLASWWEAMPLSVLEAMAAGLPVVATDVGEVRRLVEHEVTGLVVPARDRDALAAALRLLVSQPRRRREMGAAGRRRAVERFALARTVDAVADLYARLSR